MVDDQVLDGFFKVFASVSVAGGLKGIPDSAAVDLVVAVATRWGCVEGEVQVAGVTAEET